MTARHGRTAAWFVPLRLAVVYAIILSIGIAASLLSPFPARTWRAALLDALYAYLVLWVYVFLLYFERRRV